jgi:flagellar hook assembly protein FlgD
MLREQGIVEDKEIKMQSGAVKLEIYPNPFSKLTYIKFQAPNSKSQVTMKIYDVSGRTVKSFNLVSILLPLASAVSWDGRDDKGKIVPSGVYFCELKVGDDFSQTKKLLLLR